MKCLDSLIRIGNGALGDNSAYSYFILHHTLRNKVLYLNQLKR